MIQRRSKRRDLAKQKHTHTNENERIARERKKNKLQRIVWHTRYRIQFAVQAAPKTQHTVRWNENCQRCRCQDLRSFVFEKKKNHCGNRTQTGDIIYKWTCLCAVTANECNLFRRYYIKIYITSSLCFHFCTLPLLFCVLICLSNFRAFYFIVFRDELRTRHSGLTTFVDNHATICLCVCARALV